MSSELYPFLILWGLIWSGSTASELENLTRSYLPKKCVKTVPKFEPKSAPPICVDNWHDGMPKLVHTTFIMFSLVNALQLNIHKSCNAYCMCNIGNWDARWPGIYFIGDILWLTIICLLRQELFMLWCTIRDCTADRFFHFDAAQDLSLQLRPTYTTNRQTMQKKVCSQADIPFHNVKLKQ